MVLEHSEAKWICIQRVPTGQMCHIFLNSPLPWLLFLPVSFNSGILKACITLSRKHSSSSEELCLLLQVLKK